MSDTTSIIGPVVCDECRQAGQRSCVKPDGSAIAGRGESESFYDEDGRFHRHELSVYVDAFTCSRGHRFERRYRVACPADGCAS